MGCYSKYFEFYKGESKSLQIQVNVKNNNTGCTDPLEIDEQSVQAFIEVQDVKYTALPFGNNGNLISVKYTDEATAGSEQVTVDENAITVKIQSGVSTANQIIAAVNASAEAAALVLASVKIGGDGATPQTTISTTPLGGGLGDQVIVEIPAIPENLTFSRTTTPNVYIESQALGKIRIELTPDQTDVMTDGSIIVRIYKTGRVIVAVAASASKKSTIPNCA